MDNEIKKFTERAEAAEIEIKHLVEELEIIKNGNFINYFSSAENIPKELETVALENKKLKHRLAILKRAVQEEEKKRPVTSSDNSGMLCIQRELVKVFTETINRTFPDVPEVVVPVTSASKFGDYQCNAAMALSQQLKSQGVKISPREVGQKIADNMPSCPLIEKLEVAGPGFINIFLNKSYVVKILNDVLINGIRPPPLEKKYRVFVDFSSPNIAKEMHVGHLRSTIIGESICRLLEFLGHDVVRINHMGDWGTQFGMLIAHLQDKYPDYLAKPPPISDLQSFYKESKKRFDEDQKFKSRAQECVVKLQNFDPDYTQAWNLICDISRKEFQKVYDRLDIKITEMGESFYQTRMIKIVDELEKKGFLEEDEGRKIMWGKEKGVIPMTIVKSGGGFTYDTSDMACIKYRIEEGKAEWLIYVTDAGQGLHFEILKSCAERAGIFDPKKVRFDFVGFGLVLGEDKKKFKTRSGETVKLVELLDEGLKRAMDKLIEKGQDKKLTEEELKSAQEAVAYGCIKYADLSHNRCHDYVFSFDKMLEDKGNTAVYLLYANTRIKSIARTAGISPEKIKEAAKTTPVAAEHEKEWKLCKKLLQFPDVLHMITNDLLLHHLCEYVYEIACTFTEFYDCCYCVEKDSSGEIVKVNMERILLCEATAAVFACCFNILGLKSVSRM